MANILVVDDDPGILDLVANVLGKSGHQVKKMNNPMNVLNENLDYYQLIILDIMMPGLNGFELCERIRNQVDCPILFLTAKAEAEGLVQGLGLGADDYIAKPFAIKELRARIDAHLRREERKRSHGFTVGNCRFFMAGKTCYVGDVQVTLTKSEYQIAEMLALHHGQVFSKEQIYESVFGVFGESDNSVIVEHVKNIRGKLALENEAPIKTVWGVGYKWED
ncbi:response regulator transcription factor [Acetobacterium bakii]|uniref:Stage 0 sporulation protein A homolog n=1 Tax=Acetobacterium bakii TaxID=52689 RepID=A0A0L6TVQ9_9FIRM|nr:response regulator transcription factor [Acetobacterium bakii]KNZ40338.1 multidrug ABC transporter [Acetobacterium bakii]